MINNLKFCCRVSPCLIPYHLSIFINYFSFLSNSSFAWETGTWFPEKLEKTFPSVLFQKFPGGACPQRPLSSSRFKRSKGALRR